MLKFESRLHDVFIGSLHVSHTLLFRLSCLEDKTLDLYEVERIMAFNCEGTAPLSGLVKHNEYCTQIFCSPAISQFDQTEVMCSTC